MPPRFLSRFQLSAAIDANANGAKPGALIITERVPFRFRVLADNRIHRAVEGDTIFNLALRFFAGVSDRPDGLWWVIADFQPDPIHDPTLSLDVGRMLIIPSARTVRDQILSEKRREDL